MGTKQELLDKWKEMHVDVNILAAFDFIPRENFVPISLRGEAYHDHPLPTLRNQSISQPTTIMIMLQALDLKEGEKVFEIGSGGGYQAALMSRIVGNSGKVITTEVIPELVNIARENITGLNLQNIQVEEADGSSGFLEEAPFDKVVITAACPSIPQPVIDQLKENGIVIAPVGDLESQTMVKGVKVNGKLELEFLGPFRFVPLQGKYGFEEN